MPPSDRHKWFEVAAKIQRQADRAGIGHIQAPRSTRTGTSSVPLELFDETVTCGKIRNASRRLFADGHYARSVEEAFKCLNNAVKRKSGLTARDGADLMRATFSSNAPALKITALQSRSEKDEHNGYRDIFAGSMIGIRNPRAHEHELVDGPDMALELLVLANHLMRKLKDANKES